MPVSLRARLTAWYSLLVVLTLAVFAGAVLWLHWRLLPQQFDDGLQTIAATADNVFAEELEEVKIASQAAAEMVAVACTEGGVVQVLDATGRLNRSATRLMPLPAGALHPARMLPETLNGPDGHQRALSSGGEPPAPPTITSPPVCP